MLEAELLASRLIKSVQRGPGPAQNRKTEERTGNIDQADPIP